LRFPNKVSFAQKRSVHGSEVLVAVRGGVPLRNRRALLCQLAGGSAMHLQGT